HFFGRLGFDEVESLLAGSEGTKQIGGAGLATPVWGAAVERAPGRVCLGRKQIGSYEGILDGADPGICINDELRDPPALDCSILENLRPQHQSPIIASLAQWTPYRVDPELRRHVRLSLRQHRSKGRHGVAGYERHLAVETALEDDLVDMRRNGR